MNNLITIYKLFTMCYNKYIVKSFYFMEVIMNLKFNASPRYKKPNKTKYFVIQLTVDGHELREDKDIAKQLGLLTKTYRCILRKFNAKMKYESDTNILFETVEELNKAVGYLEHVFKDNMTQVVKSFLQQNINVDLESLQKLLGDDFEEAKKFVKDVSETKVIKFRRTELDSGYVYGECTNEFVEQYKELVPTITFDEIIINGFNGIKTDWDLICKYYILDEEIINECPEKLNWILISKYQNIDLNFINKHKDKLDLDMISTNIKVSQEIKDKVAKMVPEKSTSSNASKEMLGQMLGLNEEQLGRIGNVVQIGGPGQDDED